MNKIICCLSLILLSSPTVMAKTKEMKDYKCFLKTTTVDQIAFYSWPVNKLQLKIAKLPARKVPDRNDGKRAYIKEVVECVGLHETFNTAAGKKLDSLTVR
ncbi:TapY2 family type IVa secretion system protein [Shewanella pealeana]|uniref:TapY2 family type IVa secretion system protein n=1 Tax=Shewanella pealeana TaxID=70864 RepID=UPI0002DC2E85|nr:TapY2 family type IVa secretion system protein [Shewanella pealeana]